ncbi:NlpC/P60 family peptidoglycan-binding protein RipD [Mycobacterium intracellulare]|uniref:NlpC/P60 domain-containing protein n=1 Tax=Mycobacterium intracellulare TaxID=1767 RepID=A0A7R7MX33_MYCIT|nr:NlpC/P60 family peptidoglycan-binding protein RipD [Mycobacterium intracellulare]MCA2358941.1 NlpC/P60 family peptidoglycan-binding protein RipD [Mycobacterium intracellulare]MCA2367596.1 NlpC/P60 family peptidoglycan-binding protein RipD [Mycobacterium intracellulare]OBG10376.1 inv protein [Mycobacterium intracellulare]UQB89273.1 NlpC/P60 family peptidoglycan-binding protein RipD [Mycobacterium intracellulare]
MKRIYALAIGLALLGAPMVVPTVATADPGARSMDYQQATDVVIARGLSQRGVPFSWAGGGINGPTRGTGTGANTVGFDASGLMQYAYAGAGVKLPRSSGAIYRVGQKILPQQARKGDLIFYGPDGTQSVAMYLGNNQMLEVGDVVQVSPVRANGMTPYMVRILGASAPTPQAPAQQLPTQQGPAQQAPTQQAPLQQAPVQQSPFTQAPQQQLPTQQAPLQQVPTQQAPLQQVPTQQAPLQQVPTQQAPAQQVPTQRAPLQLAPTQQAPLQQAPVQQLPTQQAPLQPAGAGLTR